MTGKSSNIIQMTGRGSVTLLLSQEESKFFFWAEGRKQVGQLLSNIIHIFNLFDMVWACCILLISLGC